MTTIFAQTDESINRDRVNWDSVYIYLYFTKRVLNTCATTTMFSRFRWVFFVYKRRAPGAVFRSVFFFFFFERPVEMYVEMGREDSNTGGGLERKNWLTFVKSIFKKKLLNRLNIGPPIFSRVTFSTHNNTTIIITLLQSSACKMYIHMISVFAVKNPFTEIYAWYIRFFFTIGKKCNIYKKIIFAFRSI